MRVQTNYLNFSGENSTSKLIRDYVHGQTKLPSPPTPHQTPAPIYNAQKTALSKLLEAPLDEDYAIKMMTDPKIDLNGRDFLKWTALHKVSAWEKPRVLLRLLDHPDIVVDVSGGGGDSPLHSALSNGAVQCAEILLNDERISKTKKNDSGNTPLMLAASLGDRKIFEKLMKFGNIEEKNLEGKTAWNFAKENGHEEIANLLPAGEILEKKEVVRPTKKLNPKLIAIQEALKKRENE